MNSDSSLIENLNKYCNYIWTLSGAYNSLNIPIVYKEQSKEDIECNFERFLDDAFHVDVYYPSDEFIKFLERYKIKKVNESERLINFKLKSLLDLPIRYENQKYENFNKLFGDENHKKESKEYFYKTNPEKTVFFETRIPIIKYNEELYKFIHSISFDENGKSTFPEYFTFDNLYDAIINDVNKVIRFVGEMIGSNIVAPNTKAVFKLSTKKGSKIDFIRILNAMYELKLFKDIDGDNYPSKEKFMEKMGNCFDVDLSKYHTDLSQALQEGKLEVNLKVFDDMKSITTNMHYEKKNKN